MLLIIEVSSADCIGYKRAYLSFFVGGLPEQALFAAKHPDSDLESLVSGQLLAELRIVLSRRKFIGKLQEKNLTVDNIFQRYEAVTTLVRPDPTIVNIFRDPKDDRVLACAVGGGASIVVSSDYDVLSLKTYGEIRFLSVAEFLEEIY